MGKLWLNNELVDRLSMLQQTEFSHPKINQVALEKDWWVTARGTRYACHSASVVLRYICILTPPN